MRTHGSLTEPYVRSRDMVLNPLGSAGVFVCDPAEESTLKPGAIPHVLPGENKFLTEFTVLDGVPATPAPAPAPPPAVTTRPRMPPR